jgi:hypothetical protein
MNAPVRITRKYPIPTYRRVSVSPIEAPTIVPIIRNTINITVVNAPMVEDPNVEVDISRPMRVFFPMT